MLTVPWRLQKGPSLAFQPKSKTTAQSGSTRVDAPAVAAASDEDEEDDEEGSENDEDDEVLSELDSDAELSDENEADLEEAYAARIAAAKAKAHQATITSKKRKAPHDDDEEEEEEDENEDSDDEDEDETENVEDDGKMDLDDLIQGALAEDEPAVKSTKAGKKQSEDKGKKSAKLLKREQETPEERDARTVFLGNIPADCSTSRVRFRRFASPASPL